MSKIRTLVELEAMAFEDLTYGEITEHELDCAEYCPLYGSFCEGETQCYPMEPACTNFDTDTILIEMKRSFRKADEWQEAFEIRRAELRKQMPFKEVEDVES